MEFVCTVIQKPGVSVQLFGCLTIKRIPLGRRTALQFCRHQTDSLAGSVVVEQQEKVSSSKRVDLAWI